MRMDRYRIDIVTKMEGLYRSRQDRWRTPVAKQIDKPIYPPAGTILVEGRRM